MSAGTVDIQPSTVNDLQLSTASILLSSSGTLLSSTAAVETQPQPSTSHAVPSFFSEPRPSTSKAATSSNIVFSPEVIRPFPKAGARRVTNRKRRKTAILTDTPEKEALSIEQHNRMKRKVVSSKKDLPKNKQVKKKILPEQVNNSSSTEEECLCLVCCETFLDSVPGEGWIQCVDCKGWAHDKCVNHPLSTTYVCNNCDSDED